MVYYHDTLQLCRTGHDNMSHKGMTALACILFELFSLDRLSCNALYFEYRQDYFIESIGFCNRGCYNVLCIQNMAALMLIPPVTTSLLLHSPPPQKKKNPGFGFFVKFHLLESSKLNSSDLYFRVIH